MSDQSLSQILPSLKEGDTLYIRELEGLGKSTMKITDVFEDGFGGLVHFYELDKDYTQAEYGELYEQDFQLIYGVEVNRK